MKKVTWVKCLALLLVLMWSGTAQAISLTDSLHFKFNDVASLYTGASASALGTPVTSVFSIPSPATTPSFLRGIALDTSAQFHPSHTSVPSSVFNPVVEELTSIFYDLKLSRVTPVSAGTITTLELGFVPAGFFPYTDTIVQPGSPTATAAGGFGGHLDLYLDDKTAGTYTAFTTSLGASAFVPGGATTPTKHTAALAAGDAYPKINTAADPDAIEMEAVFAPLPPGAACAACVPGVEVLNIGLSFFTASGTIVPTLSRGFGFLNVIGGPLGAGVITGGIPADVLSGLAAGLTPAGAKALGYDISIELGLSPPPDVGAGATAWLASSEDPLHFSVPQPGTLLLLGAGLVVVAGFGRWFRRNRA